MSVNFLKGRHHPVAVIFTLAFITGAFVIILDAVMSAYVIPLNFIRHDSGGELQTNTLSSIPWNEVLGTKKVIRHFFWGQLGNVLFQYASIYCIAKQRGFVPQFRNTSEVNFLRDPQSVISKTAYNQTRFLQHKIVIEKDCCSFDEKLLTLPSDKNYVLFGFLQSWKYFEPCKEDITRLFTFKDEYVKEAENAVRGLRQRYNGRTLVGVHIRMEDHLNGRAVRAGKLIATPQYFVRAITYFRNRFPDVIFIVITSSQEWWLEHVTTSSSDVMFLPRSHPAVDMDILSDLDHLIISVGTFGWWAAYRNNGTIVCCNDFSSPGSSYSRQFLHNATEHLYPGWIRM